MRFCTEDPEQTERLGKALAMQLRAGDVIACRGDLAAGKTALTRGIAAGLGVSGPVTSPTYTIVNEYHDGRLPLFHFDMYRLGSADELFDIGWEDYLARGGVCVVEWAERVEEAFEGLPCIRVDFEKTGDTRRNITISGGRELDFTGF